MTDKEFIRAFMNIKLSNICRDLNMEKDIKNIYNLTASNEKLKAVRELIELKLKVLYEKK